MVLIAMMGALLVALGFAIGMAIEPSAGGGFGAVGALGLWLTLWIAAIAQGDSIMLTASGAKRIKEKFEAPQLWNLVEEMTIASGLGKMPAVYIIPSDTPNAFAVGRKPEKAAVAVTSGLMKRLNRDELQGVIAHEIGHIKNLDIRFMTLAGVMLGSIIMISDVFVRAMFYGGRGMRVRGRSRGGNNGGGQAQVLLFLVAIVFAILAPVLAQMLYFACSRKREFLADASGAQYTRYPEGLASALEKISGKRSSPKNVNRVLAPMYIVNPLQAHASGGMFSTHPPTEKRVKVLRAMAGAGFADFERAYQQVEGEGRSVIGAKTLAESQPVAIREKGEEPKKNQIERMQEVNDLLGLVANMIFLNCACGMKLKVPSDYKKPDVKCPRCGRKHGLPHAGKKQGHNTAAAPGLVYKRSGKGWETFQCECGRTLQLSPAFEGDSIECKGCKRSIEIER